MRILLCFLLLSVAVLPRHLSGQSPDSLVLRPGDVVQISVWGKPELSGQFRVAADGSLADAYYSDVKVAGIPFSMASGLIRSYIGRTEATPRVWVEPMFRVTVSGAVAQPNLYSVRPGTPISEVLVQAGVAAGGGRLDRVQLIRDGQATTLDLSSPVDRSADTLLRAGDRIVVAKRRPSITSVILPYTTTISAVGVVASLFLRFL